MRKFRKLIALMLAAAMALCLCGCKKKNREQATAQPVATATPNEVFEVKITMDNLWDYFYYKEYRTDVRSETDSKILSCQIAYGLQLKEIYTAANDEKHRDTMKLKFEADGIVMEGDYVVDFDTLQFTGPTYKADVTKVSETLSFWPKGNRTSTWAFGNYSTSYILYFQNFTVTDVSGSIFIKYAEPTEENVK